MAKLKIAKNKSIMVRVKKDRDSAIDIYNRLTQVVKVAA